jgi:hypothetical protein
MADGSPRAICTASSTSQKGDQRKTPPRELWGLSNTCPREQENSSLSKAECFNITTLVPKNCLQSCMVLCPLIESRGHPGVTTPKPEAQCWLPWENELITTQGHRARQAEMKKVTFQTRVWSPDGLKKYYPLRRPSRLSNF